MYKIRNTIEKNFILILFIGHNYDTFLAEKLIYYCYIRLFHDLSQYKQLINTKYPFQRGKECEGKNCPLEATITESTYIEDIGLVSFELCKNCSENFRKLKYLQKNHSYNENNTCHNHQGLNFDNKQSENYPARNSIIMGGIA